MPALTDLPDGLRKLVTECFDPDEPIVWCGQPVARRPSSVRAIVLVAAMCLLIPTVVCFFAMRSPDPADTVKATAVGGLLMGGLPLGIVLAVGLSGRAAWWGAARTAYVLTGRRAVVFDGGYGPDPWTLSYVLSVFGVAPPQHRVREWELAKLSGGFPVVRTNKVGDADVVLEEQTKVVFNDKEGRSERTTRFGFLSVADAEAVKELVAAQKAKRG